MDGLQLCTRYAFAPNQLKYCGPDAKGEIAEYLLTGTVDLGLAHYLKEFQTMYPYLAFIAHENGLADPFDRRVVEAYWLGNDLLKQVSLKAFWDHLLYKQGLKHRLKQKDLHWLSGKIPQGATIHHSFHVFNIFTPTGHHAVAHTVNSMDQCRIGWGKVLEQQNHQLKIKSQKLILQNGKLKLIITERQIHLPLSNKKYPTLISKTVSYHWNTFCDVISDQQARNLGAYTRFHLELANQTI